MTKLTSVQNNEYFLLTGALDQNRQDYKIEKFDKISRTEKMGFYYQQPNGFYYNQPKGFYYEQKPGFYYNQKPQGFYYNKPQGFYYNEEPKQGFYYQQQPKQGFYYNQPEQGFYYQQPKVRKKNLIIFFCLKRAFWSFCIP